MIIVSHRAQPHRVGGPALEVHVCRGGVVHHPTNCSPEATTFLKLLANGPNLGKATVRRNLREVAHRVERRAGEDRLEQGRVELDSHVVKVHVLVTIDEGEAFPLRAAHPTEEVPEGRVDHADRKVDGQTDRVK